MFSRVSPYWGTAAALLVYFFIQSGRSRSGAIGWDIADLVLTLLVLAAFVYKAATRWRTGKNAEMALYGGATAFLLWSAWRTVQEMQAV